MPLPPMRVLHLASEIFPLVKTGGLADVMGALPLALVDEARMHERAHPRRADVRLMLPGFASVLDALQGARVVADVAAPWGGPSAQLVCGRAAALGDLMVYVLRADDLYLRPGGPYGDGARPWGDNHRRFAILAHAATQLAAGADPQWMPSVVHSHDWHAGLAPALMHYAGLRTRSVFTIHNLAFQGLFDREAMREVGLPESAWSMEGVEYHGQLSFLKAALQFADVVTTVSPTYASEITQIEQGMGMDGVLRARPGGVRGILNGVDHAVWNPAEDVHLAQCFDVDHAEAGKLACKRALQAEMKLMPDDNALLFGVVSRLAEQKGLKLVLQGCDAILERGGQLAVLGHGDAAYEHAFTRLAALHPGRVAYEPNFRESLAHRMFAGMDVLIAASRFEPCGLTQLYALAYGALPLVHRVGGLADTVVDASLENMDDDSATGFTFDAFTLKAFTHAVRRAYALQKRPDDWARVRRAAMAKRYGWDGPARAYLSIYEQLCASLDGAGKQPMRATAQRAALPAA